ncbi:MAG: hypothetical protein HC895_12590 [Leptolyngbyaceae cyanobacterium SM1_3_5]|nr:hypothetical protein [Leptolyngbyaceae cyanobacterium SM1_3_5]
MQRTFLSKGVRSIGLMTLLSVMVGATATACTNTDSRTPTPPVASSPPAAPATAQPAQAETIVEIAAGNPDFQRL